MQTRRILIGGEWQAASEVIHVSAPFAGLPIADVYSANGEELTEAVTFAVDAAIEMRKLSRFEIAKGLRAIADGISVRRDEFASLIAEESAKPIKIARVEVERGIATFSWAAGEAERFVGQVVPVDTQP